MFIRSSIFDFEDLDNNENYNGSEWVSGYYSAPTQSLLQKWVREEHKIFVCCGISSTNYREKLLSFDTNVYTHDLGHSQTFKENSSYEQALEAGLIEALKLI